MERFDETLYVTEMYRDGYFPKFLVDKVKSALEDVVQYLESGERNTDKVQARLDKAMDAINDLQDEFDENDSEIETVARESIGRTVEDILRHYQINIDCETAISNRDW